MTSRSKTDGKTLNLTQFAMNTAHNITNKCSGNAEAVPHALAGIVYRLGVLTKQSPVQLIAQTSTIIYHQMKAEDEAAGVAASTHRGADG